jgi:glutamate/aspartate transport system substrate-binding protein
VRAKIILSALVVANLSAAPAMAQELTGTLKKIKDSGTIVLGHRESSVPFSYYDDKQRVVGYSIDICRKIVDAVKAELKLPDLEVKLNPVTSATRIPLMANGTIDLECGSTTNDLDRQKQVAFAVTDYVTAVRFVSKKTSGFRTIDDLKGKAIVSTSGTLNIKVITQLNAQRNLRLTILAAQDHAEAFLMMETGRAAAFVMDDILLSGLVAGSKTPDDYVISADPLLIEPYAIMLRRDDPAFKAVADGAVIGLFRSGEINTLYAKWFTSPIPPRGINLNVPMSEALKRVIANPTDSGDPAGY